jgi:N-terminal domain of reverse transcriptase
MTTLATAIGAPSAKPFNWKLIKWEIVEKHVRRLQLRITKAINNGRNIIAGLMEISF